MLLLVTIATAFIVGVVSYYYWSLTYWKRRNIPEPPGKSMIFGHFYSIFDNSDPISLKLPQWTKKYGKTYGIYEGLRKVLVTSDTHILNEVFVKQSENFHGRKTNPLAGNTDKNQRTHVFAARGMRWKRLRTISSPSFSNASLKKIHGIVEDSAIEMVKYLEKKTNTTEINIREYFQEYTMDIISRLSMGQANSQMFSNPYMSAIVKFFEFDFRTPISMLAHCTPIPIVVLRVLVFISARIFKNSNFQPFIEILGRITKAVDARVKQREDDKKRGLEPAEPNDFIDLFLEARVEDFYENRDEFRKNNLSVSKTLTYEEIKGQLMVFLLAGFDTTANALGYTAFLLAKHQDKMKKLQEEIDRECTGTAIDYDTLGKLKYMEAVFKETLRMFPLASSANSRECMKTTRVGEMEIEEGTFVLADTWTLHYDKEIWGPDADQFVPERWLTPNPHLPGAFLAFGNGPRVCIGMRLAYIEEKLALCHILRKFDIAEGPNTGESLKLHGAVLVHPDDVKVTIKARN